MGDRADHPKTSAGVFDQNAGGYAQSATRRDEIVRFGCHLRVTASQEELPLFGLPSHAVPRIGWLFDILHARVGCLVVSLPGRRSLPHPFLRGMLRHPLL